MNDIIARVDKSGMTKSFMIMTTVKIMSVIFGYIGALSMMRALSNGFSRRMYQIYSNWFNFGLELSILLFVVSLALFVYTIWHSKHLYPRHIFNKMDYALLVLICVVGIVIGIDEVYAWPRSSPQEFFLRYPIEEVFTFWATASLNPLRIYPVTTYILAIIMLGEFVARLRDKTLFSTLYLLAFFKTYPVWRPIGLFTFLLLASQLYLLVSYFSSPIRLFSLSAICALTYFAAYMLNLSLEYDRANVDKIKAERFKSELLTNVSHDIKTPLTSIINYVDLLKNENLEGRAADYIQVLDKKSSRLKILIDDLLEASKASTGNIRVDMQKINFGELVGQVAGEFEDNFSDKGLTLVMRNHGESEFAQVTADSRHLYRALENLFSNSAKYALEGTRVFAEITPISRTDSMDRADRTGKMNDKNGKILFALQNTARNPIEISGDELAEQFIRGDKARQTEGSGLGLYIAKSLVELMGGKFHIKVIGDLFRVEISL